MTRLGSFFMSNSTFLLVFQKWVIEMVTIFLNYFKELLYEGADIVFILIGTKMVAQICLWLPIFYIEK